MRRADGLRVEVGLALGDLRLEAVVEAPAGVVTALVGPNGAGKTTLLRAVAGQVAVDTGEIRLGEDVLDRPPGVFVPPERRRIGVVHQEYLLFPHLSALDNVAFGPRSSGTPTRAARKVARDLLDRVGLADRADARPGALSGGQQQRVALARALATDPRALLLDEPLAALDVRTRPDLRRDLRRHLTGFAGPTLLVTHELADALALAQRLVVLEGGRVTHAGTVADVLSRPTTPYVADLVGTNLLRGHGDGAGVTVDGVALPVAGPPGEVLVTVRPSDVRVGVPGGWRTRITRVDVAGDSVRLQLESPPGLVAAVALESVVAQGLAEGDEVDVALRPEGTYAAYRP